MTLTGCEGAVVRAFRFAGAVVLACVAVPLLVWSILWFFLSVQSAQSREFGRALGTLVLATVIMLVGLVAVAASLGLAEPGLVGRLRLTIVQLVRTRPTRGAPRSALQSRVPDGASPATLAGRGRGLLKRAFEGLSYPEWWPWVSLGLPLFLGLWAMSEAKDAAALHFIRRFLGVYTSLQLAYLAYWFLRKAASRVVRNAGVPGSSRQRLPDDVGDVAPRPVIPGQEAAIDNSLGAFIDTQSVPDPEVVRGQSRTGRSSVVTERFCPQCGAARGQGWAYCVGCGRRFETHGPAE